MSKQQGFDYLNRIELHRAAVQFDLCVQCECSLPTFLSEVTIGRSHQHWGKASDNLLGGSVGIFSFMRQVNMQFVDTDCYARSLLVEMHNDF